MPRSAPIEACFDHRMLPSGVEFAADVLPDRNTLSLNFRVLSGVADEPAELLGINSIVERTLAKGTRSYSGRELADAFDAIGAQWSTACGRQSTLIRVICLPEFAERCVDLVTEMLCYPTFPDEACQVAVQLAQEELKHMEDEPYDLLRVDSQKLTYGPIFGRNPGGESETLARITPADVRAHWRRYYHAGAVQLAVAGPVDPERLAGYVNERLAPLGEASLRGRPDAEFTFTPGRSHRDKELKQEYIALSLPGVPKGHPDYAAEQVMIGVLSGGMSGRLFTEVREKQGLVYWVSAWHEQPRGKGIISLGASTTPERCDKTYQTLLRELERLSEDLTEEEVNRARDSIIAHSETEDDLTRARAAGLGDDLFHFSRPIGPGPKLEALARVTAPAVEAYARRLPRAYCVSTIGPRQLG